MLFTVIPVWLRGRFRPPAQFDRVFYENPSWYSEPRRVQLGCSVLLLEKQCDYSNNMMRKFPHAILGLLLLGGLTVPGIVNAQLPSIRMHVQAKSVLTSKSAENPYWMPTISGRPTITLVLVVEQGRVTGMSSITNIPKTRTAGIFILFPFSPELRFGISWREAIMFSRWW